MLMEVAWEAIEDAGIPTAKLAGSRTGVFVGLWSSDYEGCIHDLFARSRLLCYDRRGVAIPGIRPAQPISSTFGWTELTVDTEHIHHRSLQFISACQSLWNNESEVAPWPAVRMRPVRRRLSPIRRQECSRRKGAVTWRRVCGWLCEKCEGAGMVLLKRLSQAISDGDPIYAVIRGSAINNDGRSSGLLILPSREGQKEMLRAALRDANVEGETVDYVEAHGTGTQAGDPVELAAISAVFAEKPRQRACIVGSVKTNLGHTEAASGAAGLIKAALAISKRTIPASLHFHEPNSEHSLEARSRSLCKPRRDHGLRARPFPSPA